MSFLRAAGLRVLGSRGVTLVAEASFEVSNDDFIVCMGDNGSGKSSLLRAIAGRATTTGDLERDASFASESVVFLPQDPASILVSDCTVAEHRSLVAPPASMEPSHPDELAAFFARSADTPVELLSGGEKQLLAISIALDCASGRPLLLDEPTSGLDGKNSMRVVDMLRAGRNGAPTIVVVHVFHAQPFLALATQVWRLTEDSVLTVEPATGSAEAAPSESTND